ncbi:MAG: pirin family protein [Burkholderiaceae bacterium]|nr:pirin family protein [Burkholderiaceae bacterium]
MTLPATGRTLVTPRTHDLGGGFTVRRALPAAAARSVGPFVFFDHFGPVQAGPQDNHDVRPHPHIGLATVTYLYEGAMQHRDSTGAVQRIEPGAINWMTAGRGIVHSERTPEDLRTVPRRSHGLQLWVALPEAMEATDPGFAHTPASAIPTLEVGGARLRVLVGEVFGVASPVVAASPTLFVDITMAAGDAFPAPPATERALYGVDGPFTLDGQPVPAQTLVVLAPGEEPLVAADGDVRLALVGGEPLGPRFMWWNFVSSHKARIDQAADDWAAGRFPAVPGETEFIPLPSR